MDIKERIGELEQPRYDEAGISKKRELRHEYREQKELLRQEYKEQRRSGDISWHDTIHDHREQKGILRQDYLVQKQKILDIREAAMTNVRGRIRNSVSGMLKVLVAAFLAFIQFALILILPFFLRQYTIYFYVILELLSFLLAFGLTNTNKSASFKVAWMSIALLFPVSGHIMYYLWGRKRPRRHKFRFVVDRIKESYRFINNDDDISQQMYKQLPQAKRMTKYLSASHFPLFKNNEFRYYSMGEMLFKDMFEDMLTAKRFILVNFFIVAEGDIWDMLHEIMLLKVAEGVEVIFIYDDFGAMIRTDKDFAARLNSEGIKTMTFNPIYKYTDKLIMNYRTHQKIVVIDGEIGYTGGINIADEYANLVQRFGVWKDCGIRVFGDAVWGLTMTFMQMWSICEPKAHMDYMRYRTDRTFEDNNNYCHVISDGPVHPDVHYFESIYRQIISDADERVYIMTPYLVPDGNMIQVLIEAVKRGVDVRIITPSIPDKKNVKLLTSYNYGELLKEGVRIYEYTPGFIHSKVIINEFCGVVGTVNMDYRSFYLHFENGIWLTDSNILNDINRDFEETFAESMEITYDMWLDRPFKDKARQTVLNMFATLM